MLIPFEAAYDDPEAGPAIVCFLALRDIGDLKAAAELGAKETKGLPVWNRFRYYLFSLTCHIIRCEGMLSLQNPLKKDFLIDESEPYLFRMEAAKTIGMLKAKCGGDMDRGLHYLERALAFSREIPEEEKAHCFLFSTCSEGFNKLETCGDLVNMMAKFISVNKKRWEEGVTHSLVQQLASLSDEFNTTTLNGEHIREVNPDFPFSLQRRLMSGFGGGACDCCGKSRGELQVSSLLTCGRCGLAFYCGRNCQRDQWRAGHKDHCRKKGQIELGDYMVLADLKQSEALNGQAVKVKSPSLNDPKRWDVEILIEHRTISVKAKNLKRIRPEK